MYRSQPPKPFWHALALVMLFVIVNPSRNPEDFLIHQLVRHQSIGKSTAHIADVSFDNAKDAGDRDDGRLRCCSDQPLGPAKPSRDSWIWGLLTV